MTSPICPPGFPSHRGAHWPAPGPNVPPLPLPQ
jgi:hypothetical protein